MEDATSLVGNLNAKLATLAGAEHFLVGLAPHYWAHIPMLIADVHCLGLVNGLSCIVIKQGDTNCANALGPTYQDNDVGPSQPPIQFIPVSKCTLVGVVVNVDRKPNGLTLYLIDDGTGLIDCAQWDESENYRLPSLADDGFDDPQPRFVVGDFVTVMGSLRIVSLSGHCERIDFTKTTGSWEIHDCVHEIHVTHMAHMIKKEQNRTARRFCIDPEYQHWIKCIEWKRRYGGKNATTMQNGVDALRLLGPEIARRALEQSDFPSKDDDVGAWRVFGTTCQCDLPYKQALLYCHCQASVEKLDPDLIFRDAVLITLLQLEQEMKTNGKFTFSYQAVLNDSDLCRIARGLCGSSIPLQRIFAKTFTALRKDGIIHLLNEDTDEYILISRNSVLEPLILQIKRAPIDNNHSKNEPVANPSMKLDRHSVLKNVPNARIYHVKRTAEKRKLSETKDNAMPIRIPNKDKRLTLDS